MANLSETSDFPDGIYQLETTDPVQGGAEGVSNRPLKGLANRTRWLFDKLAALAETVGTKANVNGPALTGNPTAPTQAAGEESTRLATTAYAILAAHGYYRRDVTADGSSVALTAAQTTCGIVAFGGTNNANRTYSLPSGKPRALVIENRTAGGGTVTVLTAGQSTAGIVIYPGRGAIVWTDGATAFRAVTDLTDSHLINGRASTPAAGATGEEVVNAAWVRQAISDASGFVTGDVKPTLRDDVPAGWVRATDDGTIGNPSSGANLRAATDCLALFTVLWGWWPDALCPVSGGRGASAAADFAANKTIRLPPLCGRVIGVAGRGASLSNRPMGVVVGSEAHTLSVSEMPTHAHGMGAAGWHGHSAWTAGAGRHRHGITVSQDRAPTDSGNAVDGDEPYYGTTVRYTDYVEDHAHDVGIAANGDHVHPINTNGGGGAHNNMQPTTFLNWLVKL